MSSSTLLLYDDAMVDHRPGWGHPERPERLEAIVELLHDRPIEGVGWERPPIAEPESVSRVHQERYVRYLESMRGRRGMVDGDTTLSEGSLPAAWLAAGAATRAVDAVMEDEAGAAFALVRPPGHHAESDHGMGFCLFNNVAIAAEHAIAARGCQRVLIVDWDVHHCNGTQRSFEDREDVLVFSVHRHPFFPGTGSSRSVGRRGGEGRNVNVPLHRPMGDAEYAAIFDELLVPVGQEFDPDLVLVSAGFDAHASDPLGGMDVTEEGFAALCGAALGIARRCCGGRMALTLEGGYDLDGLARSVRACVEVLCGSTPPGGFGAPDRAAVQVLAEVQALHRRWWPV